MEPTEEEIEAKKAAALARSAPKPQAGLSLSVSPGAAPAPATAPRQPLASETATFPKAPPQQAAPAPAVGPTKTDVASPTPTAQARPQQPPASRGMPLAKSGVASPPITQALLPKQTTQAAASLMPQTARTPAEAPRTLAAQVQPPPAGSFQKPAYGKAEARAMPAPPWMRAGSLAGSAFALGEPQRYAPDEDEGMNLGLGDDAMDLRSITQTPFAWHEDLEKAAPRIPVSTTYPDGSVAATASNGGVAQPAPAAPQEAPASAAPQVAGQTPVVSRSGPPAPEISQRLASTLGGAFPNPAQAAGAPAGPPGQPNATPAGRPLYEALGVTASAGSLTSKNLSSSTFGITNPKDVHIAPAGPGSYALSTPTKNAGGTPGAPGQIQPQAAAPFAVYDSAANSLTLQANAEGKLGPEALNLIHSRAANTSGSLIPVYGPGGQPKKTEAEVETMQTACEQALARLGADASPQARAAALEQAGLSPAAIKQQFDEGRLSDAQSLRLNQKLNGITEVNATTFGSQQDLGQWAAQPGNARGGWFRDGTPEQKAVAINEYYDGLAERSQGNLFTPPERIEELRREALGTIDPRWKEPGSISPGNAPKDGPAGFESIPLKEGGSTLIHSGKWTVEDLEKVHQDPAFTKASQAERDTVMNDILGSSFADFRSRPGFDQTEYRRFNEIAQQARDKSAALKTWGETGKDALTLGSNILTGIVRPIIATATDLSAKDPDGEWRMPLGNVAQQAYYWGEKGMDLDQRYSLWNLPARSNLTSELDALYQDLRNGNFPLHDRAKLDEWMAARSQQITGAQKRWYEAVQGKADPATDDGVFQHAYTHANSLLNPRNAGLMAKFMETRDPAVWKELSGHLMQTPQRAQTDEAQAKSLEESKMVRFMSENYEGGDYAEHMIAAGDPIEIASNIIPVIRGMRAGKAAVEAGVQAGKIGVRATAGALGKSAAIDLGIGGVQTFIDNPEATLGDLMQAGKENIASALGLHVAGHAYSKGKSLVTGAGKPASGPTTPVHAGEPAIDHQQVQGQGAPASAADAPTQPLAETLQTGSGGTATPDQPAQPGAGGQPTQPTPADGTNGGAAGTTGTPPATPAPHGGGTQAGPAKADAADAAGSTQHPAPPPPRVDSPPHIPDSNTSSPAPAATGKPSRPPMDAGKSGKLINNVMNLPPAQRGHPTTQADLAQAQRVVEDRVRELEGQPVPLNDAQKQELANAKAALGRIEPSAPPPSGGQPPSTPQADAGPSIPDPTTHASPAIRGKPSRPPMDAEKSGKLINNVMNLPPEQRGHPTTQADLAQAKKVVEDRARELEGQQGPLSGTQKQELAEAKAALARFAPEGTPSAGSSTHSSSGDVLPGSTSTTDGVLRPTSAATGTATNGNGGMDATTATADVPPPLPDNAPIAAIGASIESTHLSNPDVPMASAGETIAAPLTSPSGIGPSIAPNGGTPPSIHRPPDSQSPSSKGSHQAPGLRYSDHDNTDAATKDENQPAAKNPRQPTGKFYSTVFEMTLDPQDFGKSEDVHFNRANAALDKALQADPDFAARMEQLIPGIWQSVSSKGGRDNPAGHTWHHEDAPGAMRLVPRNQHKPGSPFWRALHPAKGAAGGYAKWARPAGAPKRR